MALDPNEPCATADSSVRLQSRRAHAFAGRIAVAARAGARLRSRADTGRRWRRGSGRRSHPRPSDGDCSPAGSGWHCSLRPPVV